MWLFGLGVKFIIYIRLNYIEIAMICWIDINCSDIINVSQIFRHSINPHSAFLELDGQIGLKMINWLKGVKMG